MNDDGLFEPCAVQVSQGPERVIAVATQMAGVTLLGRPSDIHATLSEGYWDFLEQTDPEGFAKLQVNFEWAHHGWFTNKGRFVDNEEAAKLHNTDVDAFAEENRENTILHPEHSDYRFEYGPGGKLRRKR